MPELSLKYALELRAERQTLFQYHGRGNEEAMRLALDKEREYVELSKELAEKEVVLNALEKIIADTENKDSEEELRIQAHYVGFLSKNRDLHSSLLKTTHADWDISQLDDERQRALLDNMDKEEILTKAFIILRDNGYTDYFSSLYREMNNEPDRREQYDYLGVFSHYCKPEWRTIMIDALNTEEDDYEKEWLAYKLLPAAIDETWKFYQDTLATGKDQHGGGEIARYGSPTDLKYFKKGAELLWKDPDALEEIGSQLKYLGYTGDFSWYWHMLSHPNARVRRSFHWLMLSFFPEEDNSMEEGWELTGWPEEEPEATTDQLRDFWIKKSDYVKLCLRPEIRYWNGKPFDIVEVFKEVYDDWDTSHWRTYANMLEMWTGRHFPLDSYALYEKQFRQYDTILAWLEEHHQDYKIGAWYRWGKQLPVS